jgi:predicted Rdx family selenoprotein
VAAELKRTVGVDAELRVGGSGEFTVWIDDKLVAEKKLGKFPSPEECVAAVKAALAQERL